MELINTIELNPYDYANSEYDYANENSKDSPEKRDEFWRKCLADKNLENLRAIKKGSYLVDIISIGNKELEGIIKNKLKEIDLADYEEQVGRICGGIVIKIENEFPVEPTCCGDIGNIQEWERIFQEETESWRQLWIGHPWIFYRKANDKIEFLDYYDANVEDLQEIKSVLEIQTSELKIKLEAIREQQVEFENRIRITLEKMGIQNSKRIAKLLTGNE